MEFKKILSAKLWKQHCIEKISFRDNCNRMDDLLLEHVAAQRISLLSRLAAESANQDENVLVTVWISELSTDLMQRLEAHRFSHDSGSC